MSFLAEVLVAILATYITFTNSFATGLTDFFTEPEVHQTELAIDRDQDDTSLLATLPSRLQTIPNLLQNNAAYQQAAVSAAADIPEPTTTNPLDAIVNIFCTFRTDDYIRTTTGTGFFIDADGVIMTNAHVAQYLLLAEADENNGADCTVRSGNPASAKYTASLLYIPPAWVQANARVMQDAVPMGTGERDYALLYVDQTIDGSDLPTSFPALPFSSDLLSNRVRNSDVVAAGYPAGALLAGNSSSDLVPRSAETSISELYTFGSNRADVFSIRGSMVGAEGASGGPVLDASGTVIGMISTRGDDTIDGTGSLRAITLSHIHRTILEETGFGLEDSLGGDLELRSSLFTQTLAPFLVTILESAQ